MDGFQRELKRGTLEMVLLKLLSVQDMYGYELVSTLENRGGKSFTVKEGTLYPVLYRLEDNGFIESYRNNPKRGVPRKYYRLTPEGFSYLGSLLEIWEEHSSALSRLLATEENSHGQD